MAKFVDRMARILAKDRAMELIELTEPEKQRELSRLRAEDEEAYRMVKDQLDQLEEMGS